MPPFVVTINEETNKAAARDEPSALASPPEARAKTHEVSIMTG